MRSLSQLNTRGQTSLPYTDNRPAGVIYDRANPTNMTAEVVTAGSFSLIPGIEVLDISQPDALNFVYVIDISQIYPASFAIAAYTVGTTMYVLNSAGVIKAGATITGTGGESNQIAANTTVVNQVTPLISGETLGGVGRYTISISQDIEDADILAASITDTGTVTVINSYSGTDTFECNTVCFLTPNMPIQFTGSVFGFTTTPINLTITSSDGSANKLSTSNTSTLTSNMPIMFSGTLFGGVVANTVYYVKDITSATQFTISQTSGGSEFDLSGGSGSMTLRQSYFVKTVSSSEFSISDTPGGAVVQLTESSGSMTASGPFGALCLVVTSSGGGITPGSYLGASGLPAGVQVVAEIAGGTNSAGTYSLSGPAVALGSRQMYTALNFSNTNPRGSVTWATTPAGVTVSQTLGVYTVSLDTAAQWAVMRNPTVTLPANWADDFTISSYVDTDIAASKNWTTTVDVTFGANITSTATIFARLTGTQNFNAAISSLAAQAVSYRRYRATGASITASASISPSGIKRVGVSAAISSISTLVTSASVNRPSAAAISAVSTLNAPRLGMMKGQAAITSTASMVTNAQIFRGIFLNGNGQAAVASAIPSDYIISTNTVNHSAQSVIYGYDPQSTYFTNQTRFGYASGSTAIIKTYPNTTEATLTADSGTVNSIVSGNSDFSSFTFVSSTGGNSYDLYVYDRSGTTWSRNVKFSSITSTIDLDLDMSRDGQWIAFAVNDDLSPPYNSAKIYVYQKSGGSWSLYSTINLTTAGSLQGQIRISDNGDYVFWNKASAVEIYVKSGGSYSLQQSYTVSSTGKLAVTSAGDYFIVAQDSTEKGVVVPRTLGESASLAVAITTTGNTNVTVDDITGFTSSGFIQIGNEVLSYSGITPASNRFDGVVRARGEAVAATYSISTTVRQVLDPWTDLRTTRGQLLIVKRTGSSWALEQQLGIEGNTILGFGEAIYCLGTLANVQVLISQLPRPLISYNRI